VRVYFSPPQLQLYNNFHNNDHDNYHNYHNFNNDHVNDHDNYDNSRTLPCPSRLSIEEYSGLDQHDCNRSEHMHGLVPQRHFLRFCVTAV
jgi:hypothetical protein